MSEECTCNEEFQTGPCPVHFQGATKPGFIADNSVVVTDSVLVSKEMLPMWGYAFECQKCKKPLLHQFKYCAGCGNKIILQSQVVTDYWKKLNKGGV